MRSKHVVAACLVAAVAFAAYTNIPEGMEGGLEGVYYYDPPNMTYPFGAYICVVDIDADTGVTDSKPQPVPAFDDCFGFDPQHYITGAGELYGIAEKVDQHLP